MNQAFLGDGTDITGLVQVAYDTAVGSMDYSSGFLDNEEVAALKRLADLMGFEAVNYQTDVCANCGHAWSRHGRSGSCWASPDGGYRRHNEDGQCDCPGFAQL